MTNNNALAKEIVSVRLEDELKQSYLDYAMSVIVGRALPDVRDGLKPVHRRVLFAMHELKNDFNKPYKKSARIVGDVIGKYHPHSDTAVYDTIVRMAQSFSLRYLLIDGQGNFGSVDGDAAAAMRYTEIRMAALAHALLADLDKETVEFALNYDGTEMIPAVLPTRIPNLLVNGSSGIAVGMATNVPPHNLSEIVDACLALIENPTLTIDDLMRIIPGPDFPTAGIINGRAGIVSAYRTGRGRLFIRAKTHFETDHKNREKIIVTELPYQVNKARLIERIAELVKEKQIEGITALRDESDKQGMRIMIEIRRGDVPDVILNNLFAQTQMQNVFGINMVALVDGQPRLLNLKELLEAFLRHRREIVMRRTIFELRKARERAHLLEGLTVALTNVDEMIALIKSCSTPTQAKEKLLAKVWPAGPVSTMLSQAGGTDSSIVDDLPEGCGLSDIGYRLSPQQAQAILDLRLHRLTGLEQEKIIKEYEGLLILIAELLRILSSDEKLLEVIKNELIEVKNQFGDSRRTDIIETQEDLTIEDLLTEEDRVVTLSREGYVKTQPVNDYEAQHRGGKGKSATTMKEDDFIDRLVIASSHDTILCFSNLGKVYWLKVYELPQASRNARGKPIINILPLAAGERINAILPVRAFDENHFIFMAMASGTVKKISLKYFSRPRANGIIAVDLTGDDHLIGADITEGNQEIMLFSNAGKAVRFHESKVRAMGRTARGVRGIKLQPGQRVISLIIVTPDCTVLTATENGYGKRTAIDEYRVCGRGGQGVISIQVSTRNGQVVGAEKVHAGDEVMLITNRGTLVRTRTEEISVIGRNTQGVRLINLNSEERLVSIERIAMLADLDDNPS